MAFFGLTALGPQNQIKALKKEHSLLQVFTPKDVADAFGRVDTAREGSISAGQLPDFLTELYHGAANPGELQRLQGEFCAGGGTSVAGAGRRISDQEIITGMERIQMGLERSTKENQYKAVDKSSGELREMNRRHIRPQEGPEDMYVAPLTATQDIGWQATHPNPHRQAIRGKKSCPETIYQSELIKSGIFY